jgi:hypothetical protein
LIQKKRSNPFFYDIDSDKKINNKKRHRKRQENKDELEKISLTNGGNLLGCGSSGLMCGSSGL